MIYSIELNPKKIKTNSKPKKEEKLLLHDDECDRDEVQ
jgi:hypothetical protein